MLRWHYISDGAEQAVISGDPERVGSPYVIRFRTTKIIDVAPHWHPEDENISVLEGPFALGYGSIFDALALNSFPVGSSFCVPKEVRHFASYGKGTVVEVSGIGPFQITYVDCGEARISSPH